LAATGGFDADATADEADALVCMKDDVEVNQNDPRCMHPSGRCRFRESCRVTESIRALRRRARRPPRRRGVHMNGRA
jgi:hypothetical protein